MKMPVYVTGNANKARYFSQLIGHAVESASADVFEIQSLDLIEVVTAKAKEAYAQLKRPVLVEDTSLRIVCMGKLPGTFIKWFIEELGLRKICELANADPERLAVASAAYAYYDGEHLKIFEGIKAGKIAQVPKGDSGFGWNPTFIPEGCTQTLGEMDEDTFITEYLKIKPIEKVRQFLDNLEA